MKDRRHIIKIKTKFQDRLALENVLVAFIFINILILISFFLTKSVDDTWLLRFNFSILLVIGELCGLVVVYFYSIKASHRIAGPLYRLEKQFAELAGGDLTVRIGLRKNDYFQDTAACFNETVASLREKIAGIKETAEALRREQGYEGKAADLVDVLVTQLSTLKTESKNTDGAVTTEATLTQGNVVPESSAGDIR